MRRVFCGLLGLSFVVFAGCRMSRHAGNAQAPAVPPPDGWHVVYRSVQGNLSRWTFTPKKNALPGETIAMVWWRNPPFISKPPDDLMRIFSPTWEPGCKSVTHNVIRKDYADMLYEEDGTDCRKRPYRLFIARVARGQSVVSYLGFRADVNQLSPEKKQSMLAYLNSAPLDKASSSSTMQ